MVGEKGDEGPPGPPGPKGQRGMPGEWDIKTAILWQEQSTQRAYCRLHFEQPSSAFTRIFPKLMSNC